jgi:hypothetical protein
MLHGEAPHGDLPHGDMDLSTSLSIADALDALLEKPWLARSWWLRAKPRDASTATTPPTLLDVDLSTDGHKTYPADAEEIQLDEAIIVPYSVSFGLDGLWGVASMDLGEIVIGNPRGERTSLLDEDWVGRQADVYVGPRGGLMIQFARVAQLLSGQIQWQRPTITLQVYDHSFLFDRKVQDSSFYAGTGGLEGGAEIEGNPKPLLFGQLRQLEPTLVDGTNRIYQIHDGQMQSVDAVRDQGIALAFDADVADITTATPGAGEYATSLATGYIKLGSTPIGTVTGDFKGHNSSSYGYVDDVAGLTKLLAVDYAGLTDPGELDLVAFTALEAHTATMGHWTGTQSQTVRDVLSIFHQAAASWVWLQPNKVLTVGRITDPDAATVDFSLTVSTDEDNPRDDLREEPWEVQPWEIPVGRVLVGYRRYFRTMSDSELAGAVPEATRKDYAEEYRFAKAEDAAVFVQTPDAAEITILTQLDSSADAQALADEQLALRKVSRRLGRFAPRTGLIKRGIGDVFSLTDDRLPTSPKKWVIVGVENAAEREGTADEITWECFG